MSTLRQAVIDEFMKIVQIDSLSFKEQAMFEYIKGRLAALGIEGEYLPYTEKNTGNSSGNLIVKLASNSKKVKKVLFFDAHLDTVEPGIGIKPQLLSDRITSDGTTILGSDDKAGVAAMLISIEEIVKQGLEHGDVYFLFTSAEEVGLAGINNLDFSKVKADFGYVLDSHGPVGAIITAAPYHYIYDIWIEGKASHAGIAPQDGINAIKIAARILEQLPQGQINADTVANIGMIDGGRATNIVADNCHIKGEFRSVNKKDCEQLETIIKTIVNTLGKEAVSIKLDQILAYEGFKFREDEDIIRTVEQAVQAIGITPRLEETRGGSHSNIYNQNGVKAVTLSTGMEELHSTKEYIKLDDLENTTRLILKLIELA